MPQRLNATLIKGLAPKKNRYVITDTKAPGLAVIVNPSGNKYFYYRFRPAGSKKIQEISLGNASIMSIDDARAAASIKAGEAAKGVDLKAQKQDKVKKEKSDIKNRDLLLFNYIDQYYKPYAQQHSVCADEIVKALKSNFEFLADKPIDQISSIDIEIWRKDRRNEITFDRMKRIFTYLKACLNSAVKHYKLIDSYELQYYSLKRKPTEKVNEKFERFLLKKEEKRLRAALRKRDQELREKRSRYVKHQAARNSKRRELETFDINDFPDHITPIIIIAYQTGLDQGDIFDLDWQTHIFFDTNQIRKTRNKTKHKANNPIVVTIEMTPAVRSALEQWGEQHGMKGRIFKSPRTGGRIDNIDNAWKSVKTEAKIENFRIKDLRHTFGSWLAIAGVDLITIRDLMGHRNIETTEIYAHLRPDSKASAVQKVFPNN